jgi:hypothetical protein
MKSSRGKRNQKEGPVERNHDRTTAGRYNINMEDTNTQSGQVDDA